jgi:hypothetical protein
MSHSRSVSSETQHNSLRLYQEGFGVHLAPLLLAHGQIFVRMKEGSS